MSCVSCLRNLFLSWDLLHFLLSILKFWVFFTLMSLIHLELIFIDGAKIFHSKSQLSQHFLLVCSLSLSRNAADIINHIPTYAWICFWHSVLLISLSSPAPIPHCFNYYRFQIGLGICQGLILFQNCLVSSWSLALLHEF